MPTGPNGRIIERDIDELRKTGHAVTSAALPEYEKGAQYEATGIGGRITAEDIIKGKVMPISKAATTEYVEEKLSNIRKLIAKTMHASVSDMAQLTMNATFDATNMLKYRAQVKANMEKLGLANITINDIIVYAAAKVLVNHKDLNANFNGETMKRYNTVHMGVAIDTARGLMVPTLFYCDMKSLNDISLELKELAEKAKAGNINPDLLSGGTFTITNLGNLGVESFTPIINPPQTAILGVCGLTTRIKEVNGEIKTYQAMGLSLTIDHRVVDGAPAAKFLKDLCTSLESFDLTLAK
jgi:pyruvate dehydrogenase E2 component (dihydrolipoamide acetyltransferase)